MSALTHYKQLLPTKLTVTSVDLLVGCVQCVSVCGGGCGGGDGDVGVGVRVSSGVLTAHSPVHRSLKA